MAIGPSARVRRATAPTHMSPGLNAATVPSGIVAIMSVPDRRIEYGSPLPACSAEACSKPYL